MLEHKSNCNFPGIGFSNNENFLYTLHNVGQRSERLFEVSFTKGQCN